MTPRNHRLVKDLLDPRRVAPVIVKKTAKIVATSSSSESSGEDSLSEYESFWSDDLQTNPGPDYVLSRGSYLSGAQEERVMALLQEIQPESTVYIAVMRKCHIVKPGPYLVI